MTEREHRPLAGKGVQNRPTAADTEYGVVIRVDGAVVDCEMVVAPDAYHALVRSAVLRDQLEDASGEFTVEVGPG